MTAVAISQLRKWRVTDIWYLARDHTVCKKQSQDLNPGLSDLRGQLFLALRGVQGAWEGVRETQGPGADKQLCPPQLPCAIPEYPRHHPFLCRVHRLCRGFPPHSDVHLPHGLQLLVAELLDGAGLRGECRGGSGWLL